MIGQQNLISRIDNMISTDTLPKFIILVGSKGSGRKTLAVEIANMFEIKVIDYVENSIDSVRQMIVDANKTKLYGVMYVLKDADTMSVQAKNALLKIVEEPPKKAYFVMILDDVNNMLETIRSRAAVYNMEPYTADEIQRYAKNTYNEVSEIYSDLCETPGEVDTLYKSDAGQFVAFAQSVVDNIQRVSLANALKISNRIALKSEDEDKYDLKLFWKAFMRLCSVTMFENAEYIEWIRITSKALKKLRIRGINKQMLFDNWIFDIRDWR